MWRKGNKSSSLLILSALLLSGCSAQNKSEEAYTTGVFAMGTYMTLTAYGESAEALGMSASELVFQTMDALIDAIVLRQE